MENSCIIQVNIKPLRKNKADHVLNLLREREFLRLEVPGGSTEAKMSNCGKIVYTHTRKLNIKKIHKG